MRCDYRGAACHIQLSLSACQGLPLIGCCCSHECFLEKKKTTTWSFQGAKKRKKQIQFALLWVPVFLFYILATFKVSGSKLLFVFFCFFDVSLFVWCLRLATAASKKCQTRGGVPTAYISITLAPNDTLWMLTKLRDCQQSQRQTPAPLMMRVKFYTAEAQKKHTSNGSK